MHWNKIVFCVRVLQPKLEHELEKPDDQVPELQLGLELEKLELSDSITRKQNSIFSNFNVWC